MVTYFSIEVLGQDERKRALQVSQPHIINAFFANQIIGDSKEIKGSSFLWQTISMVGLRSVRSAFMKKNRVVET